MKLKTIFSILTICFAFAFSTSAQEKFAEAISSDQFVTAHKTGLFSFNLPEDISAKDVALSAEFYTIYFTIDFDEETHVVKMKLADKEELTKRVMGRFFISLGIREIVYEDKVYSIDEFYKVHLRVAEK